MCLPGVEEAGWVVVDPGDPSPSTTGSRRGDTVNPQIQIENGVFRFLLENEK